MPKIQLSVSSDYLPEWGVYEGLRELVQNYIDSQDDCQVKGEIRYEGGSYQGKVYLVNHGAKFLDRESLLFGVTSKYGRRDQRGEKGEGMKVGTLALVRAGREVVIRTQRENWTATLSRSDAFGGRQVLTFNTHKRQTVTDDVTVEISPVFKEEWEKIVKAFRFLQPMESKDGYNGSILSGDEEKGKCFAKGIFVKHFPDMKWGYDLADITLNRDRSMVDEYDVRARVVNLISDLYNDGNVEIRDIRSMFEDNTWEVQNYWHWSGTKVMKDLIKVISAGMTGKFIITASNQEALRAETLGYSAIRIPKSLLDACSFVSDSYSKDFRETIPGLYSLQEMESEMRDSILQEFPLDTLDESESNNLKWAIHLLASVDIHIAPKVISFRESDYLGLFKGGEIFIARTCLNNRHDTLGVLIHEYSHFFGGDGTVAHSSSIESVWLKISKMMIK